MEVAEFVLRWFHFLAGITWIGVLYYFNFIQTPFFGTELGATAKGAMTRELVPNALWWFRWGAMFTFLTGWLIVAMKLHGGVPLTSGYFTRILTGGAMGTLMWANVWFVIWPAQKIVIENANKVAGGAEPNPAAAAAGGKAGMASRTNTLFSIPMLFFMAAASHLPSLARGADVGDGVQTYWIAALIVIALVEINGLIGPGAASQKPLTTVSGTIHAGVVLTAVLMLAQMFLI
ncbi:MAG: urate hydroxylase PuuD [Deltaproteobacteria bacterium]|nr:urate hydroxylase PuuD [Deltaproteobacteria bacterium]MBW2359943.1 urate hydroxylase PuuD [Deltaproteobacteria bacterium]